MILYFFAILAFAVILTAAIAGYSAAPWVPTWKKDINRFLKLAQIKSNERFYDLGSGDGRLVAAAAKQGAKAGGFEMSLLPYLASQLRNFFSSKKFKTYFKNFYKADLTDADLIYVFLRPEPYEKLKAKFEKELKPGARVITYVWPIQGWQAVKIDQQEGYPKMYLYNR